MKVKKEEITLVEVEGRNMLNEYISFRGIWYAVHEKSDELKRIIHCDRKNVLLDELVNNEKRTRS